MKRKVKADATEQFMHEAMSWETDRVANAEKSATLAWRVAGVASFCCICAVIGISVMGPLKEVIPLPIRIDVVKGVVEPMKKLEDGETNYDEVINKYFVNKYVQLRASYSQKLAEDTYNAVGLMSAEDEKRRFAEYFSPKRNAKSPLVVQGTHDIRYRQKSISFIKPDVALVRYEKIAETATKSIVSHCAATVEFVYIAGSMKDSDRELNPLGFQAKSYRSDPDAGSTNFSDCAEVVEQAE